MDANRQRLAFFLLLNVFVSACVTIGILFVYDRYYRPSTMPALPLANNSTAVTLEIASVIGAGIPTTETVIVRNAGDSAANLSGWQVRDADGHIYTFKDINIPARAAVQLHTSPGQDTTVDLYWGLSVSTWSPGETVSLLDPAGTVRSVYKVP